MKDDSKIILNGFKILKSISERLIKHKKNLHDKIFEGNQEKFYFSIEERFINIVFCFSVKKGMDFEKTQISVNNINNMEIRIEKLYVEFLLPIALVFKPYDLNYKFIQNSESNTNNDKTKINSEIMAVEDGKVKIEELEDQLSYKVNIKENISSYQYKEGDKSDLYNLKRISIDCKNSSDTDCATISPNDSNESTLKVVS